MRNRLSAAAMMALVVVSLVVHGGAASGSERLRVGLVVPFGGVSDPFLHGAFVGLQRAVRELHVQGRVVTASPNGTWGPAFSYLGRKKYDLIIGIGFQEAHDLAIAARRFPSTKFAILDAPWEVLNGRPKNAEGTVFRTEQSSFLAGYLAARMDRRRSARKTISSVAGYANPPVKAFIAGYQAGARRADRGITVLNTYTNDFVNAAKCKRAALEQIARGSGVVFDVAGGCGLGALEAAKQEGAWGIGVDVDQSYLGPFILTSVVKRLDVAVYQFVRSLEQGRFRNGANAVFDLRNGGVGLGKFSPVVTPSLQRQLERLRVQIVRGEIKVPTTVK